MLVCPNCNHPNPDGAQACEACYTPLPATTNCPNCATPVQTDARFCGQCGFDLRSSSTTATSPSVGIDLPSTIPDLAPPEPPHSVTPDPLVQPEPLVSSLNAPEATSAPVTEVINISTNRGELSVSSAKSEQVTSGDENSGDLSISPPQSQPLPPPVAASSKTQLQQHKAQLLHVQTNTLMELPQNISVVHIGKPNDRIPPDVDVAGFPNSEIVSRIHADIRIEGDAFYLEDVGSSNGTYVNNMPLPPGNRHRLRVGDRIALGKGDLVTLLFQLA